MLNEDVVWTKYNLNNKTNVLPQYEKYVSYSTKLQSTTGLLKIFDQNIQLDTSMPSEQNKTLKYIAFTTLIDTVAFSYYRERCLLDVSVRIRDSNSLSNSITVTPINATLGQQIYAIIAYKKITDTPTTTFQVQIYVYLPLSLTDIRFTFLDFYTKGDLNRYAISGYPDRYNSVRDRLEYYLGNNIINNTVVSSIDSSFTQSSSINKPFQDITYTAGTSIDIYAETKFILINASSARSIDSLTPYGICPKGQIVTLKFYNGNTTIVNTGNIDTGESNKIVLKGLTNVTPTTKGQTITLQYDGIKWIEIGRNF